MHAASTWFVAQVLDLKAREFGGPFGSVLEIGGRNVNGSVRSLFDPCTSYMAIDVIEGPGVDLVADGRSWQNARLVDCVLSLNTFEHVPDWHLIISNAYDMLCTGGWLVVTAPADPFPAHSGIDGRHVREGEHYENIPAGKLIGTVCSYGFDLLMVQCIPPDSMVCAVKP